MRNPGYAFEQEDHAWINAHTTVEPRLFADAKIPTEVDPRGVLRIEMQGGMGSCRGHSLSSGMERLFWIATGGEIIQLSRYAAYRWCQEVDGIRGDRGATIAGGMKVGTEIGLPLESMAVYPRGYVNYFEDEKGRRVSDAELRKAAEGFRFRSFVPVRDYQHAKQLLGTGWVLDWGTRWPIRMDGSATVTRFSAGNQGHARLIAGYLADGRLCDANSHDETFGDDGWMYWTEAAFNACLRDSYTVIRAVSDMASPKPRRVDHRGRLGGVK